MSSAIGSSVSPVAGGTPLNAGLQAQLTRCQVSLADWVACPSSKTPAGKAKIAQLKSQIRDIQRQLESANGAGQAGANTPGKIAPASPTGTMGHRLDVFA
jgi:hypothetical protein